MKTDLTHRTALVTGASSGFGRHFAQLLAAHGAEVVAVARRRERLEAVVAEILDHGGKAHALALDVTEGGDVARAISALERVDIVVNNAGVAGTSRALDCTQEEWRRTFDINVNGAWYVAQEAARKMIATRSGGSIINIASITGVRPIAIGPDYAASKAALIHLTKSLAMEWARHGIRVNAIVPGFFETDLSRDFIQSDYGQAMLKRIPQRRFGQLEELDGPLLLLASDASSYMTGSILEVDGGHLVSPL